MSTVTCCVGLCRSSSQSGATWSHGHCSFTHCWNHCLAFEHAGFSYHAQSFIHTWVCFLLDRVWGITFVTEFVLRRVCCYLCAHVFLTNKRAKTLFEGIGTRIYYKLGNFSCWNCFRVAKDYEKKTHKIYSTNSYGITTSCVEGLPFTCQFFSNGCSIQLYRHSNFKWSKVFVAFPCSPFIHVWK